MEVPASFDGRSRRTDDVPMSADHGSRAPRPRRIAAVIVAVAILGVIGVGVVLTQALIPRSPLMDGTPRATASRSNDARPTGSTEPSVTPRSAEPGSSRGYLTTPDELAEIARRAAADEEPFATGVAELMELADIAWDHNIEARARCPGADEPAWLDDRAGTPLLYAKAIAYHLTGDDRYAAEVRQGLERIISTVEEIALDEQQCRLNFSWGTPELVAAADLIEGYWSDETCVGPETTAVDDPAIGEGPCKERFANWLVKYPYYVTSYTALASQSNWGAAATTTMATIADYLWDRPDAELVHRQPAGSGDDEWTDVTLSPAAAYELANQLALDRMNGYRVELNSNESCDYLSGDQQHPDWPPVKSQITHLGIIPEDARRDEFCNIPEYDGSYQNYPQIHIGNLVQQCELMLRRGDRECYENVNETDEPEYSFIGPDGEERTTHLLPGRGSLERAINAVIVDAGTEWRRGSALAVAYRYYREHSRLGEVDAWRRHIRPGASAPQDLSFGDLTHALIEGEAAPPPPVVAPPRDED